MRRGFRADCAADSVVVTGYDDEGVLQGGFLSGRMHEHKARSLLGCWQYRTRAVLLAPYGSLRVWIFPCTPTRIWAPSPREGFDSILLCVKGVDEANTGHIDFNALCRCAAQRGLRSMGCYVYSHLMNRAHPNDPGAQAYYDSVYGSIFEACPAFKGIVLVGEAVEFPFQRREDDGTLAVYA